MNDKLSVIEIENPNHEPKPQPPAPAQPAAIPNSQLSTNHSPLSPGLPRRPRSKIARLPSTVRELLNHSLREGLDDVEICVRLSTLGHNDISPRNVSSWARTGYRQWLREQTQMQTALAQTKAALTQLGRPSQPDAPDLPLLIDTFLADLLQQIFQDFDPASLKPLFAEKPAEFFRLLQSLNGHLSARAADKRSELDRARCQVEVSEKTQSRRQTQPSVRPLWDIQRRLQEQQPKDPVTLALQRLDDPQPPETDPATTETVPE